MEQRCTSTTHARSNVLVIAAVRKDEQRRLIQEGNLDAASSLKRTKYILTSSRDTLARKDKEAEVGKVIDRGGCPVPEGRCDQKARICCQYKELLSQNELLITLDIIKENLSATYELTAVTDMAEQISNIMDLCEATENRHLLWSQRLLNNHFEGIIARATYSISTGKLEGLNNEIKTARRQRYGYPDDDYFCLKLFDARRRGPGQIPLFHKKSD